MNAAPPRRSFAVLLDAERRAQHLSIRDVARIADVPPATVQGWLSGKHLPVPALRRHYLRIVDRLGLSDRVPEGLWDDTWSGGGAQLGNPRNPYLGLRPFGTADRDLFFGRKQETRRLAQAVLDRRESDGHGLVVVLGASGSGKSSLLSAGLVATEVVDGLLAGWTVAQVAAAELPSGPEPAAELIVIDQAEELFTLDDELQAAALASLAGLAERAVVVMAMRADAFVAAIQEPVLAEAVARPFLIAPLGRDQIREVILGPAELVGTTVEEELVAMVLDDLPPGPHPGTVAVDVLPLLSSALMLTWAAGKDGRMTTADYVRAGGVAAAVQGLAEEVYQSLDETQQDALRRVLLRLVRLAGDLVVRDSLPLADLDAAARPAIDAFTAARMLTVTSEAVRISHDTLLVQWSRLQEWIAESRSDLAALERLRRAAQVWEDSCRSPDALIRVERLEAFSDWVDDPRLDLLLTPREREFVAASREHFASQLTRERHVNRRLRRGRNVAVGLTSLVSALVVVVSLLYWRGLELQAQTDLARRESQSRQVAVEARSLRAQDPNLVAQMALVAERLADTRQGASALLDATSMNTPLRWLGAPNAVMAKSSDDSMVARANGDGEVTLWRAAELESSPGRTFQTEPAGPLFAVALATVSGRRLLVAGGVSSASLWDVTAEPVLVADLRDGDYTVLGAAFDASGERLALATSTGKVALWSISADPPRRIGEVELGPETSARAVAFNPVNDELFVAGPGNAVARWRLSGTPQRLADLSFAIGDVPVVSQTVAVSPDGRHVAAGVAGRSVFRWRLEGDDAIAEPTLTGFMSWTNDVSYSSDSSTLLVANSDQNAYLFDVATGELQQTLGGTTTVLGVESVGGRPVTSGTDGALRVWQAENPVLRTGSSAYALATDAGLRRLAVTTLSDGIALWDVAGDAPRRLPDPEVGGRTMSSGLAVAPDGSYLLGGTADGEVLRWMLLSDGAGAPEVVARLPGWRVASLAVSPDSSLVAASEYTGTRTALFGSSATADLTRLATLDTPAPQSFSFSPDGGVLAIQADGDVQLWDVSDPPRPALIRKLGVPTALVATFAHHSRLLAVGTVDGDVSLWDVSDPGEPVQHRRYADLRSGVNAFDFSPDDSLLIAGGGDERVWAWRLDVEDAEAYLALDGDLGRTWDVRFIKDGGELVAAGNNGIVRRWTADLDDARRSLCAGRGEPLTQEEWQSYLPGVTPEDPC